MISEGGGDSVNGRLECGPESKAQRFVGGVSQAAARPGGLTGSMRQLEVSVYSLKIKRMRVRLVCRRFQIRYIKLLLCSDLLMLGFFI